MLPLFPRATVTGLALAVLAVVLSACTLLQAERVVVRSFTYWLVIECRGDVVPSANSCRDWGERVIAANPYPAPEPTRRLLLTNERGQCQGAFLDRDGNSLESFGVTCP